MKAVPRKQLWRCRYHCSDYRGILVFFALTIPVVALLMGAQNNCSYFCCVLWYNCGGTEGKTYSYTCLWYKGRA